MYQNLSRTDDSNHRHGKNLMTYNKVGERVQSCNKYHSSMKVFFKKYSKNNLKLAYIHPIKHHVDIGLLGINPLFELTRHTPGSSPSSDWLRRKMDFEWVKINFTP